MNSPSAPAGCRQALDRLFRASRGPARMRVLAAGLLTAALACAPREGEGGDAGEGAPPPPPAAEPSEVPEGATARERCRAFHERGLAVPVDSRASLRAALGGPEEVSVATEPNRHIPEATDSVFTVRYPDLVVTIRRVPDGGELTESAMVRDPRHLRYRVLGPGATREGLVEALGEPDATEDGTLVYACGTGPVDEPVRFDLSDGIVRVVRFSYYVD